MRNISFAITKEQVRARTKTVTRRMNWLNLKAGDLLCGVEKGQGLKPGEKLVRLCVIRVVDVSREMLQEICELPDDEVLREGFPGMTPDQFVEMFCKSHKNCTPTSWVTRIEFEYVENIGMAGGVDDWVTEGRKLE